MTENDNNCGDTKQEIMKQHIMQSSSMDMLDSQYSQLRITLANQRRFCITTMTRKGIF